MRGQLFERDVAVDDGEDARDEGEDQQHDHHDPGGAEGVMMLSAVIALHRYPDELAEDDAEESVDSRSRS